MRGFVIPAVVAICLSSPACAGEFQDLAELDARVSSALGGNGVAVPIDRRIKLAKCGNVPEIAAPANGSVAIRCPDQGWRLAVTVTGLSMQAPGVINEILVRRGDTIEVLARGSGFSVSSTGVAMDEGGAGRSVRVKMPTSSAPISAVVLRAGVVAISF
jgi:flagella basal body P-ring formation protein FlgA